jgi:hypothetical protein
VSRRVRVLAYGAAGAFVVAGMVSAALVPEPLGPPLAMALIGAGLVLVLSLVFMEVGLSEDRARAHEESASAGSHPSRSRPSAPGGARNAPAGPSGRPRLVRRRPERLRGQRRRLR